MQQLMGSVEQEGEGRVDVPEQRSGVRVTRVTRETRGGGRKRTGKAVLVYMDKREKGDQETRY